jgi:branched-chain amino acid transport system permease protein
MNVLIAFLLTQDGLTNGAIYALVALALVMVFSVTRVILVPQGEIIAFAALTLASLRSGVAPALLWLIVAGGALVAAVDLATWLRDRRQRHALKSALAYLVVPLLIAGAGWLGARANLPYALQIALTILIVVPIGPILYRLAFQPVENSSVLVLLIIAVAVHVGLLGLGLLAFGTEGVRTPPIVAGQISLGGLTLPGQALFVWAVALGLIALLFLFFGRTLHGKALRATAFNRTGARLMGVSTSAAGTTTFALAALIGAVSGILVAPLTTIYYDTGFLIGLKGFVAAIVGGLVSYPLAALGAVALGLTETYASFWASLFKDAIVFAAIVPILLLRSLLSPHTEEDDEE